MANEVHMCRSEWVYCDGDCGSCQRANYAATNRTGVVMDEFFFVLRSANCWELLFNKIGTSQKASQEADQ